MGSYSSFENLFLGDNMKKIVLMIVAALAVVGCSQKPAEVTVINPSHKTSPAAVFATSYRDATGASYYQSANCEDAGRKYNNTENAVFIYNSSMEFAGRNKGLNCNLEPLDNKTIVFVGQHYFKLCRLPGSNANLVPGGHPKQMTMGIASMLATQSHQKTFNDKGVNVKIVPYSGSKTVAKALLAGDIDIGFMGQGIAAKQGDRIECLHSTNPAADNYLASTVDVAVPDFHISYVVYTNSTDPEVIARLKNVGNSDIFQAYLAKSKTTGNFDITPASSNAAIEYVNRLYKNWADK